MASYALRFLTAVLSEGDPKQLMKYGRLDHLFELDAVAEPVFTFVDEYLSQTSKLPSIDLVEDETGVPLKAEDAAPEWLHEKATETHIQRSLKLMVEDAKKDVNDDPRKAMNSMAMRLSELKAAEVAPLVADFKEAYEILWPYLQNKWLSLDELVGFGWPYLDSQTGGLRPGDLVSLVGRPGQGKTWFLLWIALFIWAKLKKPIIFVSMEMDREEILERLAAIYTETEADFFKFGTAPTMFGAKKNLKASVKKKLKELMESDAAPFIVVDGNLTATVEDVVSLVQQYGASACLIDGAYMLESDAGRTIYEKVAINVRLLKQKLARTLGVPTICSWQFAKLEKKLRKGEKPSLENIGYSDAIAQYSSIVLGLLQADDQSNIENLYEREIDVLKGRSGQTGKFKVRWDFKKMDFSEALPPDKIKIFN